MKKKVLSIAAIIGLATVGYFAVNSDGNSGNDILSSNIEALGNTASPTIPCQPNGESCTYVDKLASGEGIELTLYGLEKAN